MQLRAGSVPRLRRRVLTWGMCALVGGAALGAILGIVFADHGGVGFWILTVAPSIFLAGACGFTAGISSLESPQPGD